MDEEVFEDMEGSIFEEETFTFEEEPQFEMEMETFTFAEEFIEEFFVNEEFFGGYISLEQMKSLLK